MPIAPAGLGTLFWVVSLSHPGWPVAARLNGPTVKLLVVIAPPPLGGFFRATQPVAATASNATIAVAMVRVIRIPVPPEPSNAPPTVPPRLDPDHEQNMRI